jgi:hypothetical protein
MRRITIVASAIALGALVPMDAAAQWNVARFDRENDRVYAAVGLDPALVTTIGYGRIIPVAGHPFQASIDAGVVTAGVDAKDFRTRVGIQTAVVRWRSLYLTGTGTFIARGTDNVIYRGLNLGADVTGALGVYRPGWFAAAEFGKDKAIITHITHSDWYREHHYADARDGWYLDAGGTYHYGAVGGIAIGRAEVLGRFGFHRTEDFNDLTPPLYASVGIGFGF